MNCDMIIMAFLSYWSFDTFRLRE